MGYDFEVSNNTLWDQNLFRKELMYGYLAISNDEAPTRPGINRNMGKLNVNRDFLPVTRHHEKAIRSRVTPGADLCVFDHCDLLLLSLFCLHRALYLTL